MGSLIHLLIQQTFVEGLLGVRHQPRSWRYGVGKTDIVPASLSLLFDGETYLF